MMSFFVVKESFVKQLIVLLKVENKRLGDLSEWLFFHGSFFTLRH